MRSATFWTLTAAAVAACSPTAPPAYGTLQNRIVSGGQQSFVAGAASSDQAVNLTYRQLIAARPSAPARVRDWLLPAYAYADTTVSIRAVPGAVACVSEDQTDLVPLARCVTADGAGLSSYRFPRIPSRAGEYCAHIYSTYGTETTALAPVCITIKAGPVARDKAWFMAPIPSGAALSDQAVQDSYGNPVPFRLLADSTVTIMDTALASNGSRTAVFGPIAIDTVWHGPFDVLGKGDTVVARSMFNVRMVFGEPRIEWHIYGLNLKTP